VFNGSFQQVSLAGNFVDPNLPKKYAAFNIQNLGGKLYVTYARQDKSGDGLPDGGSGFVSVFDLNGNFLQRLAGKSHLDQPWGLAVAPSNFGAFSGALLVANHGSGRIAAFDPATGEFLGALRDERGRPVQIDGLWGLTFGNGVNRTGFGDLNALYFTAGPEDGREGLLGSLRAVTPAMPSDALTALQGEDES
jgi:uncharacterized protein (TIGR03118 family)